MIFKDLEKTIELLKTKTPLVYLNGNNTEIICKCWKCSDLLSKSTHGHLYIGIDTPVFNCYKCNYKGIVKNLILSFGADPEEYLEKDGLILDKKQIRLRTAFFDKINNQIQHKEETEINKFIDKMEYLKIRLGSELNFKYIKNCIFNIKKFIEINNIELSESDSKLLDLYSKNYIGFMTNRRTSLILRSISKNDFIRHKKLSIISNNQQYLKDFYGIKINEITSDINTIVLCEGIFDLLAGLHSTELENIRNSSVYWAAVLGKGFYNSIHSILNYLQIPCANIIILSDKDVLSKQYTFIKKHPMVRNLELYYNKLNKDFGEISKGIELIKYTKNEIKF